MRNLNEGATRQGAPPRRGCQAALSADSMARLNRSVDKRSWQPGQLVPGFLNQLTVLVILIPHLGQVTVIVLSSIISAPYMKID
jgi:hypothetical protein